MPAGRPGLSRPGATRIVTTRTTVTPASISGPVQPPVSAPAAAAGRSARRRDIQGLRALAVIAVIGNHVTGWPAGGFVGVDIFFVLSGFLITGILLHEHESAGRISLRAFYANRVRRILPAAAVVLVVTSAIGFVLFTPTRALSTAWDALWSLVFVANWRFTAVGNDYFQAALGGSAVQHYWSLSVEEQFYLVWPGLMMLLFALARALRTPGRGRLAIAALATVIVLVSFGYAVWQSAANPTAGYFSTFSRAWELGIGALLATATPLCSRMPFALRFVLGWLGLAGIIASFVIVDGTVAFPGPWAALPVLATALVIIGGTTIGGTGGPQRHLFPLTNRLSAYLGDISYSLYLWHFPVFVFLTLLRPGASLATTLLIFGTTLAVSLVSYYLIEQPLHRSPWLGGARTGPERRSAWRAWRGRFGTQIILSSVGAFVIVMVVAVSAQLHDRPLTPLAAPAPAPASAEAEPGPADANPSLQLQADLAAAVAATAWPQNLSPTLERVMNTTSSDNPARACFDIGETADADECTWGDQDAPHHMYLVGDSEALSYAPAFKAMAQASAGQWKITTLGLYGCRFTAVHVANEGAGVMAACPQRKLDVTGQINADAPELVVVANAFALGQDIHRTPLSVATLVESTVAETAGYTAAGAIVTLAPPPLGAELGQCYSTVTSPQNCNMGVGQTWQDFATATQAAAAAGQYFVSSLGFSCSAGICPAFAGTIPTKYDTVHLTTAYAEHISPVIRSELSALGLM